ncbi:alpha/beta hydrolase [Streptomyces sp. NPDC051132]|uniref:alpha/beta fold hydrolase n=1 Tax=unclassified Streptomyces TaxID=2593676 RepID=UPI00343519F4
MDILLIAGLWLDGSAWDDVMPELTALGHHPVPLTLPGQGDGAASATLDDQMKAVLAAVDAAPGKPLVVGHSSASTLAWLAADARPEKVAKAVLIGGFPAADGRAYADYFAIEGGAMPFPGGIPSRARTPPTWTSRPGTASRPPPFLSPRRSPGESCA